MAYRGVRDGVFGTPGTWDYWACVCSVLYLDPRPAGKGAAEAYERYYTHGTAGAQPRWREPGFRGAVRRGYLNARYGYRFADASRLAGLTWPLRRAAVKNLDFMIRHLPAPHVGGNRLLDAGCGNGDFLAVAADLGFAAKGLDPDPAAVAVAQSRGFDVRRGGLPGSGETMGAFDHVLLSHVLEHLAEPVAALAEARSLLTPGGRLWLSLPNRASAGLRRFGGHWRGLEPPRHFALFDPPRLRSLLAALSFERICLLPPEEAAFFYYRQSQAIVHGLDPYGAQDPPGWKPLRRRAALANVAARLFPASADTVTLVAFTPSSAAGRDRFAR
ncbi:MAG TPA: class I SAM-dependent methyltransferase [Allosphingosinicella sp.]|nr:class I SAM-dependent methyltransferase [Allosphingosinicella sp.]